MSTNFKVRLWERIIGAVDPDDEYRVASHHDVSKVQWKDHEAWTTQRRS